MEWLRQSTAVVKQFGPFVDKTDGVTLKTGLVSALDHASTGIMLAKNGGTLTIRHATVTASTYDAHGLYKVTLDTTDTGTLGKLKMIYTDAATCLPVWMDFMVVPAMIYDSIILGSDRLDVNATHFADQAITAAAGVTLPSSVASPTNITAGTITTVTNVTNAPSAGDLTATMKTSVQTAADAALIAENLDHFMKVAVDTDYGTTVHANSALGHVTAVSATTSFNRTTDSLEAFENNGLTLALINAGFILASGTIGATGNDTTHLHLAGLAYGDDAINNCLLTILDVSTGLYYSTWISDWANTGDLATVPTLPFTPQASTDTYWLLPARQDVTGGSGLDAAGVRAAVGLASANLDTQLTTIDDFLDTEVAAIKAKTDNLPAAPASTTNITAGTITTVTNLTNAPTAGDLTATMKTSVTTAASAATPVATLGSSERNSIAAAHLDLADGIETGLTPRQAYKLFAAALAGKLSGAATTTVVIRNAVADSKNRITATVDADGNRSAVTLDLT